MSHHDLLDLGFRKIVVFPASLGIRSAHPHEEDIIVKTFKSFQGLRSNRRERDLVDVIPYLVNASDRPDLREVACDVRRMCHDTQGVSLGRR